MIPKSGTRESISSLQSHSQHDDTGSLSIIDEDRISICSSAYSNEVSKRGGSLARIDLLGRYESLFDNSLCIANESSRGIRNIFNRYVKHPIVQVQFEPKE